MDKIGFIGSYDKTDFIVQIAKILTVLGKKVIVIDTSLIQKAKYIIPVINPTKAYVTEFEEIDVSVGFNTAEQINAYLGINNLESIYDVALIDIDSIKVFDSFDMYKASANYFVTSFDLYSLKRGLEVIAELKEKIKIKKVLFSRMVNVEDDEYLNFLSSNYNVIWDKDMIYFPLENGDQTAIIENQRVAKVKFKDLTSIYKESILLIVSEIVENTNLNFLRKILKNIEKGV